MHKKAVYVFAPMRDDETNFVTPKGNKIVARRVAYDIDGGNANTVDCPLTQTQVEIPSIPDGSEVEILVSNVLDDAGQTASSTIKITGVAPSEPITVPVPDAGTLTFQDMVDPNPPPDTTTTS